MSSSTPMTEKWAIWDRLLVEFTAREHSKAGAIIPLTTDYAIVPEQVTHLGWSRQSA